MSELPISAEDRYERKRLKILDSEMAYIDEGEGDPIIFLHGNPTSSYLWRNIMPYCEGLGRILAPDLIGMGASAENPSGSYRFVDHFRYLNAWFDAVGVSENAILVIHDWGSGLGFHWANLNREKMQGIVYMEAIVRPVTFDEWPESARGIFQGMRSPKGEELVLERNFFVERILPASIMRKMTDDEMKVYRAPFLEEGERRRPTLTWPREIPFDGEPADVHQFVTNYSEWLSNDISLPKLFVNAEPGIILTGAQREYCRAWPNQEEITVKGLHFVQEDSPHEIGKATAEFAKRLRAE
ncbi:MAG: haloalkane dehalogenase [Chloroflexota bacterium]